MYKQSNGHMTMTNEN